ncbi:hypothetical protein KCG44_06535 [Pacificimonas sp. WHA3]|uniref:Glycerophosphoryl diester phosphodiesterase membrane domain-containing protein n=1 Tax=Pacificimonas pallii TaxID=2827236 RepID=A0ABS6SET2_9SPHN|nr:hypothetical protein [Pacificimonas pallii]MBV7256441.1 hypothetical protein [Pacificimonas pallii]
MEAARTFDIGRVVTRMFMTIRDNPGPFAIVSVALGALPLILYMFFTYEYMMRANFRELGLVGGIFGFLAALCPAIMGIACIEMTAQSADRGNIDLGAVLKRSLTALLPIMVHMLLWMLGFYAGLLLLLVPGIMIACMWSVSFPALIIERRGIIGSFGRSQALTKGARWKVFALYVLIIVFWIAQSAIDTLLTVSLTDMLLFQEQLNISMTFKIVSPIVSTLSYVLYGVLLGSMFIELRNAAEGPKMDTLRDVFA